MTSSSWRDTTLGEFVRLQRGHDLPERDRRRGTVPIMGSAGQNGFHDTAKAKGPGVVIGRSGVGSMGVVTFCSTDFWPHNTVLYVTDFLGNDERFTYYLLQQLDLRRFDSGSAQASLNRNYIYPIPVRVPWPPEQRAIAQILGALDDKIELNQRMNETLESMARAIFKAWFVDFEPVKAKAVGASGFRGMPQHLFDHLPDQFIESELGPIPAGWEVVPIGDLVDVIGGGTPSTKNLEYWEGGKHPFCTPRDMSRLASSVLLNTERHITQAGVEKISSGQIPTGAVLLSSRAPIGYLAIAKTPVSVNQGIIAMLTRDLPNTYVLLWAGENMEVIKARAGGSTFAEISKRNFRPIPALQPDKRSLTVFDEIVRPLFDLITTNEQEVGVLAIIRDALLPKLVSGEIRVPGVEGLDDAQ